MQERRASARKSRDATPVYCTLNPSILATLSQGNHAMPSIILFHEQYSAANRKVLGKFKSKTPIRVCQVARQNVRAVSYRRVQVARKRRTCASTYGIANSWMYCAISQPLRAPFRCSK